MVAVRLAASIAALALVACESAAPPPPPILAPAAPRTARELPGAGIPPGEAPAARVVDPTRPGATGDRELDALRLGFHGCRVMGLRLQPSMSGRATLHARLGAMGEVLDVQPVLVEGLPHTVVSCLVEHVWSQRFDPRGGAGSILVIPVDFTREAQAASPRPTIAPTPTQAL